VELAEMSINHSDELEDTNEHIPINPDPSATAAEWRSMLSLCQKERAIGFGALDSFLSGADLECRVALVEAEAPSNEWLRAELRDTLSLNQAKDWTIDQHARLTRVAFGLPTR
jgi:hypothetical protein